MLPKTGIYYLPDFRVIGFLNMMEERQKHHVNTLEYFSINQLQMKYKIVANLELKRQIRKM